MQENGIVINEEQMMMLFKSMMDQFEQQTKKLFESVFKKMTDDRMSYEKKIKELNEIIAQMMNASRMGEMPSLPKSKYQSVPTSEIIKVDEVINKSGMRPPLKGLIISIMSESMEGYSASSIWKLVNRKGSWSRQSVYNALNDNKVFNKKGDGTSAVFSLIRSVEKKKVEEETDEEEETKNFLQRVEKSRAIGNVV